MPSLLFPDNTVLCNYAAVNELSLLQELLRSNGRWTQAVYAEALRSSRQIPQLGAVASEGWLGEPIEIEDHEQVENIRLARLGGSRTRPFEHLGEAETCHLIHNVTGYRDSIWITDDGAAFDFGRQLGIITWDTRTTVEQLIAEGTLTARDGFALMGAMWSAERSPRRMPERWQELQ